MESPSPPEPDTSPGENLQTPPEPAPPLGAGLQTPPEPAPPLGAGLQTPPEPAPSLGAGLQTPPEPATEGLSPTNNAPIQNRGFAIIPDPARLEALAEFAAGAGHEINNPLATIIGRAQQLLKEERDPQRRQMLQSIGAQAYRVRDMIGDAMLFGRPPRPEIQKINLSNAAEHAVSRLAESLADAHCDVILSISSEIDLSADPAQFAIVLTELLRNSRQALLPAGGTIQLRAMACDPGHARIEVEDHGTGFTDLEREHAFDPFFSGRQAGRGLGFGLPKIWQIVRLHGGSIQIESADSGPTIVRIMWPTPS